MVSKMSNAVTDAVPSNTGVSRKRSVRLKAVPIVDQQKIAVMARKKAFEFTVSFIGRVEMYFANLLKINKIQVHRFVVNRFCQLV